MKTLSAIKALENYKLQCTFNDGTQKVADISVYLDAPAFVLLKQPNIFKNVSNQNYFVEWKDCDVDLSADTLWHIGVESV